MHEMKNDFQPLRLRQPITVPKKKRPKRTKQIKVWGRGVKERKQAVKVLLAILLNFFLAAFEKN